MVYVNNHIQVQLFLAWCGCRPVEEWLRRPILIQHTTGKMDLVWVHPYSQCLFFYLSQLFLLNPSGIESSHFWLLLLFVQILATHVCTKPFCIKELWLYSGDWSCSSVQTQFLSVQKMRRPQFSEAIRKSSFLPVGCSNTPRKKRYKVNR